MNIICMSKLHNPYGDGKSAHRIIKLQLKKLELIKR